MGIDDDQIIRFRCRVGHAYSPETLLAEQSDSVEIALWAGLRALEENAALMYRMAKSMREKGNQKSAARFRRTGRRCSGACGDVATVDPWEGKPYRRGAGYR